MTDADVRLAYSNRFRRVSNRYSLRVAEAYGGDLRRAMADSDKQVAANVAAWEKAQDLPIFDWQAIRAEERDETPSDQAGAAS